MAEPSVAAVKAVDPDVQLASHSQPPVLRRLPWPQRAPVDLLVQCPWLVLHQKPLDEWNERESERASDSVHAQREEPAEGDQYDYHEKSPECLPRRSPLKQRLRAPREPPVNQSPAQRAARKMLKLQEELEKQEAKNARQQASHVASQLKKATASPPIASSEGNWNRQTQVLKTVKRKTAKTPVDDSPQACLQRWLGKQRLQTDDDVTSGGSSDYSMEMETRIHAKMSSTLGAGLWKDEVASLIAAELTSESVFGGFVPTRRLAFDPVALVVKPQLLSEDSPTDSVVPTSSPPRSVVHRDADTTTTAKAPTMSTPASPVRASAVEIFADEVRDEARELVAKGHVYDALQSLQAGIDRVLHDFQDNQDEITTHGFDFSALAHSKAIRLQLTYKARHRRRLASLLTLQRVWRRFRARNKFRKERQYQATNARVIQLYYKKRFHNRQRESSATRIQKCFRIFQQQKTLIRLHQACRLLNVQERRKRERMQQRKALRRRVWSKLKVVLRLIRLFRIRRFSICWLQSRWRGWKARQSYAVVLAVMEDVELVRRSDEDAFVEPRLARVMEILEAFYRETSPGRAQVKWMARQPWLRWRRLRSQWQHVKTSERVAALCGIYGPYTVVRGLERAAVETLITGKSWDKPSWQQAIAVSAEELYQWLDSASRRVATATSHPTAVKSRGRYHILEKMKIKASAVKITWLKRIAKAQHYVTTTRDQLMWHAVVYPKCVLRNLRMRRERGEAATLELLAEQRRVWRSLLRHVFRVTGNTPPKFVCTWCGEGCATAKAFFLHRNSSGGCKDEQQRVQLKAKDTRADVEFHMNRFDFKAMAWRRKSRRNAASPAEAATPAQFNAVRGRRVAKARRNRVALRRLVDAAQCCGPPGGSYPATLIPQELLTLLLSSMDDDRDHPLVRVQAIAVKAAVWSSTGTPPVGWIPTEEVERDLGLTPATGTVSGRLGRSWRSLQDAVKGTWRTWRDAGGRYRSPTATGAGHSRVVVAA